MIKDRLVRPGLLHFEVLSYAEIDGFQFLLFINDLPDALPLCKIIIFTDDVVIFSSHWDLAVLFNNFECILQGVSF